MPDTASAAAVAAVAAPATTAPEPLRLRRPDGVPPQLPLTPALDLPQTTVQVPSSPPPSYEEVLAEVCNPFVINSNAHTSLVVNTFLLCLLYIIMVVCF